MTPKEAGVVLAKAATFDNRRPDAQAATSWAHALGDIPLVDAVAAVEAHYAESTDWVMPAHVRRRVVLLRAARLALVTEPALPPDLTGWEYARVLAAWRRQIANGGEPDLALALAAVGRHELTRGAE